MRHRSTATAGLLLGGVFPLMVVPGFSKVLATFIPIGYLADGLRSLMFFDGCGVGRRRVGLVRARATRYNRRNSHFR